MLLVSYSPQNLPEFMALEEALLEQAESCANASEYFMTWEAPQVAVVIGRASRIESEVNVSVCQAEGIPVYRRVSGGCAVVVGTGCLLYSVILSYERHPHLQILEEVHRFVSQRLQQAITAAGVAVTRAGTCDLVWQNRKLSGNSLKCKRRAVLYHGTILYDFPLELLDRYLLQPPREPEYRNHRTHSEFVTNIPVNLQQLKTNLPIAFNVAGSHNVVDTATIQSLLTTRYLNPKWHWER